MESIKQVTGKIFEDGPYEYKIYIKSGDLGLGNINSISLFVENTPDHIGVDLIIYAMGRLIDVAGEELKSSEDEFMINSIYMEKYETLGEMVTAMGFSTELGLQSFSQLNAAILKNRDKKIDLKNINDNITIRSNKLTKALSYIANNFTSPIDGINFNIVYEVSGKPVRAKNDISPGLNVVVNLTPDRKINPITDYQKKNLIISAFKDQLSDISPIQIQAYDRLAINIKN
jgi:predicted RNA-binding protein Jag